MAIMTDSSRGGSVSALALASALSAGAVGAEAQSPSETDPEDAAQDETAEPPGDNLVVRYRPRQLRRLCEHPDLRPDRCGDNGHARG